MNDEQTVHHAKVWQKVGKKAQNTAVGRVLSCELIVVGEVVHHLSIS